MPKALPVVENDVVTGYMIFCPACQCGHKFNTAPNLGRPVWTFVNNDVERPTFVASMLVKSGCQASGHKKGDDCWCTYEKRYGEPAPFSCCRCHSHVKDGKIQFLSDCTHALKGTTVELPDWDTLNKGDK